MLNTCASGILIYSIISFSILDPIPSTPGDLFAFVLFILLATTSGVTTNCLNISPSVPLNFVYGTGNELVSSLVNTELKSILVPRPFEIPVLLYSQHCSPVVQPYIEHSAYFLLTHINSYCLILNF